MESKPKKELVRIVCTLQGELMLDYTGKANGRGVYLCPNAECISKARKKKAVGRGFERELEPEQLERIFEELSAYEGENP
jgi:hypothetical protein